MPSMDGQGLLIDSALNSLNMIGGDELLYLFCCFLRVHSPMGAL